MKLTAVYSVSTLSVGLALAGGLGQGDTRLPAAFVQPPTLRLPAPKPRALPLPRMVIPKAPPLSVPGDVMPHSYMVYGLRTGPGGMAFTDRSGAVIPVPSNAQIQMGPFNARPFSPQIFPPTFTLPKLTVPKLNLPKITLPK